jgi:hypothetical protein
MTTQAKASLYDLYPEDRKAIERIRSRLELNSDALTIRVALRSLAARLNESPKIPPSELTIGTPESLDIPSTKEATKN